LYRGIRRRTLRKAFDPIENFMMQLSGRNHLAAFDFAEGSLILTEAGTRRASLHVVSGESELDALKRR
jgi:hypothetical protein